MSSTDDNPRRFLLGHVRHEFETLAYPVARRIYSRAANYAPRYAGITRDLSFDREIAFRVNNPSWSLCKRLHEIFFSKTNGLLARKNKFVSVLSAR